MHATLEPMAGLRTRNVFDPGSPEPFKLSRSKMEDFLRCPRCFYLDRRLGVGRPAQFPFTLNSAVDHLLKKEFDIHRAKREKHPLMECYGVDAIPFSHPQLNEWRENFVGIQYHHEPTNFIITGAVDDLWVDPKGTLIVVDYKSTSKDTPVGIEAEWQSGYRNQMELYQWLLRRLGFSVSPVGYFVYANGRRDVRAFDGKLEFDITLIPYEGGDRWVEGAILEAHQCLLGDRPPESASKCEYCQYRQAAGSAIRSHIQGDY
ncbi:MAG: hypothetical protein UY68_C0018G0008 [Parcubacteria group bacterium GW2011_GWF2_52_12]|nr:MAG: hypothetical protein UY66_C0021G0014 [Parcubacteria group bacterium GW2011_GWC1_51_35]KKW23851.1 MAG: hypothetical protein UY68_C0018G0008 [Parcubacteria group bacterium GW2011_GWF2_52_12]KKW27432.1 MAG: hypothetical protein UY69_C0013G0029 [Parcubacteria group bacterium GW2011_GWF1_52_5]KKW34355.1 MAG: hypothetical protein UY80_C0021G0006 [Parcubacteria group bacterium GW2011_GWB1_53_43]